MDALTPFILALAEQASAAGFNHYAADLYMAALARTNGRVPAYLLRANQCRALALGVVAS